MNRWLDSYKVFHLKESPQSISSCLIEENDLNLSEAVMKTGLDITRTDDSVSSHTSKCQFNSRENISEFMKETETASLIVQEMFVGSNEVRLCEFNQTQNSSEESEHVFRFKFPLNFNINMSQASDEIRSSGFEVMDRVGNGLLQDRDRSYEADSNRIISHVSASDESNRVFDHTEESREIEEDNRIELEETSYYNNYSDDDDDDEEDETDVLREHQSLVEQMKMELKNCRIKGLPTISEEHESPKTLDDMKHFEIEPKFEYKDAVDEIRKFYKIYAEKMRKLDILNFQTLQAISFLEMKDRHEFTPRNKKTGSTRPKQFDTRKVHADPSHNKSTSETSRDLELIYVGQVCLSWEILAWSYMKAQELQKYDSKGNHSYNRVSEEFQQFQVLLNRFIEDEPFQGGDRTTSYVRRRCMIRNLLQVPMIKEDCYKDKKGRTEETDSISLEILLSVIKESMVVFWDFLYADKRAVNSMLRVVRGKKVDDDKESSNSRLLADVIEDLYKKEKRIKESIRSQSCMLKKLKKQQQCKSDEVFKSQVDLRLVSRVLSLPKLTKDQMLWCQMKLNNIDFVSTKIVHVEPSFLLLPC